MRKKNFPKIAAILTGKGGSKLKNKNILKINNIPLLGYSCREAKKVNLIKNFFVSSENNKILKQANKFGFITIRRPKYLSKNNTLHGDVLLHALNHLKQKKNLPEIVVILLANSATIKAKWILKSIRMLIKNRKATACVPVVENNDNHPFRAKRISKGKFLKSFFKFNRKISSNRQDLEKNYFLCHNFWTIKTESIFKKNGDAPWTFMGKFVLPLKIESSVDIHERRDILLTKYWLKKNKIKAY